MDFEKLYYLLKNEIVKNYEKLGSYKLDYENYSHRFTMGEFYAYTDLLLFCDDLEKKEI